MLVLDSLRDNVQIEQYQPYWAARACLLARLGSAEAACDAYRRAIGLEADPVVREYLQKEMARCARQSM
jgi:RNA polymerase sigma-70 factor (ECF subfamily)